MKDQCFAPIRKQSEDVYSQNYHSDSSMFNNKEIKIKRYIANEIIMIDRHRDYMYRKSSTILKSLQNQWASTSPGTQDQYKNIVFFFTHNVYLEVMFFCYLQYPQSTWSEMNFFNIQIRSLLWKLYNDAKIIQEGLNK